MQTNFKILILICCWGLVLNVNADTLRFGLPNKVGPLELYKPSMAQNKYLLGLVFESLVRFNPKSELEPVLAKRWQFNEKEGLAIIELGKDIRFSDGSQLKSADVVNSFRQTCKHDHDSRKDFPSILGCTEGQPMIKALDDYSVQIKFRGAPGMLLRELAGFRAAIAKKAGNRLVGTGPYIFSKLDNNQLHLVPNSERARGAGKMPVEFLSIGETNVQDSLSKLKLDGSIMFRFPTLSQAIPGFQLVDDQTNVVMALIPNLKRPPFNDLEFRRELFNRLSFNSDFKKCFVDIRPAFGLIPSGIGGSSAHLPRKLHVETNAIKKLQVKYSGKSITLHRHLNRKNMCEEKVVQSAFKSLGIKANIVYHENYENLMSQIRKHEIDGFMELFIFANRDATSILSKLTISKDNYANIQSDFVDQILEKVWLANTASDRFKLYRNINDKLSTDGLVYGLYYTSHRNAISNCLSGVTDDFAFNPFLGIALLERNKKCK